MGRLTSDLRTRLDRVLSDPAAWWALVGKRQQQLHRFLAWARACEAGGRTTSLRLENRDDIGRCARVLDLFTERWWGVVVYSCFDSAIGAESAAPAFRQPVPGDLAEDVLARLDFPRGSVRHHRAQSTLTGAKRSLASACEKAAELKQALCATGLTFDERFRRLDDDVDVSWWGRTTCFDALLRAGALEVATKPYRPDKAYLAGSKGPASGFEQVWGFAVTRSTADECEQVLQKWTSEWGEIAEIAEVDWPGEPYDSADFENALCVFQEPPALHRPDASGFAEASGPHRRVRARC